MKKVYVNEGSHLVKQTFQDILEIETNELWDYIMKSTHSDVIKLSAKVNSFKTILDTAIKHLVYNQSDFKRLNDIKQLQELQEEPLLTVKEVANKLKFSTVTIYEKIKNGTIEAVQIGSKWRIKKSEVDRIKRG